MRHLFLCRFAGGAFIFLMLLATAAPALAAEPDATPTPVPAPTPVPTASPTPTPAGGVDPEPVDPDAAVVLSGIVLDHEETPVPLEYGAVWGTTVGGKRFHVAADSRPRDGHSLLITPAGTFHARVPRFAVATIQLQGLGRVNGSGNCSSAVVLRAEKRMTREDVTPGRALTLIAREERVGGSCAATPGAAPGAGGSAETGGTDAAPTQGADGATGAGIAREAPSREEIAGLTPPATAASDAAAEPAETPLHQLLVVLVATALALVAGPGSAVARRRRLH